jgi:hypothetical protein
MKNKAIQREKLVKILFKTFEDLSMTYGKIFIN